MFRQARALMTTVAVLGALGGSTAWVSGQPPPAPGPVAPLAVSPNSNLPPPPPVAQGLPPIPVPVPPGPPSAPVPYCPNPTYGPAGGPPACAPFQDRNGPLLQNDPRLDPPFLSPPGWFVGVELDFDGVHVKNGLLAPVAVGNLGTDLVHLPSTSLDGTTSPRINVGYRFPEGFGEVLLSYHSLVSQGTQVLGDFDPAGDGFLKGRLDLNSFDLDYASQEFSLLPHLGMKWWAGLRFANVYFDSNAVGFIAQEKTSNSFWGIGPNAGLDLAYHIQDVPGLAVITRLEGATLLGQVKQSYGESISTDLGLIGGATTNHGSQAVPVLHFQLGVSYVPPAGRDRVRFSLGYEFEQWWSIGQLNGSTADLTVNGMFFRTEFNY